MEGENTFIDKIIAISNEEISKGETIIPRLLFESGYLPAGHKLYRCITKYRQPASEYIGRRIGFTRIGDTHKMFVEANFVPGRVGVNLFYMWSGFYMDCPELDNYTQFGVIIGATTRMVLTEKCLNKKAPPIRRAFYF